MVFFLFFLLRGFSYFPFGCFLLCFSFVFLLVVRCASHVTLILPTLGLCHNRAVLPTLSTYVYGSHTHHIKTFFRAGLQFFHFSFRQIFLLLPFEKKYIRLFFNFIYFLLFPAMVALFIFISYSFHCNYWKTVCMHPPSSFGVSILFPSCISFVLISLRRTCKERLIE